MSALYSRLVSSVQTSFTADTAIGSAVLQNPSTTDGLFIGLPVFGKGIPRFATLLSTDPLTLSAPATVNGTAVSLTTGFQFTSRRMQFWDKVSAQPALFLRKGEKGRFDYANNILSSQYIPAEVWIYNNAGQNPDVVPETGLNNLLDAVQRVFEPDSPMVGRFTLGGLVHWCRVVGETTDSGDLDGQGIALLDIEIIVP